MGDPRNHVGRLQPGDIALMKDIADATAKEVSKAMFTAMGLDTTKPIEAQQTFAALRRIAERMDSPDRQADDDWVRRWRPRTEGAFGKVFAAIITLCTVGAGTSIVAGARTLLSKGN